MQINDTPIGYFYRSKKHALHFQNAYQRRIDEIRQYNNMRLRTLVCWLEC